MARPLRIAYEGAVYHLTSRGNEKKAIYKTDTDRRYFLRVLSDVVKRFRWICHAYCQMTNHFHLLIETPLANISQGMRHLNGVYSSYFNRIHQRVGHLFQGRFTGIIVEKQTYAMELCRYIPLNPVRAGICARPEEWPWSNYAATRGLVPRPSFLKTDWTLNQFGNDRKDAALQYEQFVLDGIGRKSPWDDLKGQIYLGSDAFVSKIQEMEEKESEEIPWPQRSPLRPDLTELLKRDQGIKQAYWEHGYLLKEIAASLDVHYTTVSRWLNKR